jgi:hypothetical protein
VSNELITLVTRLHSHPGLDPVEFFVGRLPDHLPFEPPLPEGAAVIGGEAQGPSFTVVLDTHRSPEEVIEFYRAHLRSSEWAPLDQHRPGGFVPRPSRDLALLRRDGSLSLTVMAYGLPGSPTDVRLHLNADRDRMPMPDPFFPTVRRCYPLLACHLGAASSRAAAAAGARPLATPKRTSR